MKKLIAILLVLLLLPTVALADSTDELINQWNAQTYTYPAPQLSKDQYVEGGFVGDGWKVMFREEGGRFISAGVYAEDSDIFLPMCIIAAIIMVKKYETSDLFTFIGRLTYSYYTLRNGIDMIAAPFGLYIFDISEVQDGYLFTIAEI